MKKPPYRIVTDLWIESGMQENKRRQQERNPFRSAFYWFVFLTLIGCSIYILTHP